MSVDAPMTLDQLRARAEQGDAEAQCALGHCYAQGKGVPKDLDLALVFYDQAAESSNPEIAKKAKTEQEKICQQIAQGEDTKMKAQLKEWQTSTPKIRKRMSVRSRFLVMGGICLVFIVVLFIGMRGFSETKQDHIQTQKINESLQLAVDKENDKKKIEEIATKKMEENEQIELEKNEQIEMEENRKILGEEVQCAVNSPGKLSAYQQKQNDRITKCVSWINRDTGIFTILFNYETSKQGYPRFNFIVRFFDVNGKYLTHFTTEERFTTSATIANGTRILSQKSKLILLKETDNLLQYQINLREAHFVGFVEFGVVR